jgi:hypothetical protein
MASEVSVGFTKNPRQLAAKAKDASAANAQITRSFDFDEDMFLLRLQYCDDPVIAMTHNRDEPGLRPSAIAMTGSPSPVKTYRHENCSREVSRRLSHSSAICPRQPTDSFGVEWHTLG